MASKQNFTSISRPLKYFATKATKKKWWIRNEQCSSRSSELCRSGDENLLNGWKEEKKEEVFTRFYDFFGTVL